MLTTTLHHPSQSILLSQLELADANGGESSQWIPDGPLRPQVHLGVQLHHRHRRVRDPLLRSELSSSSPRLPSQRIFRWLRPSNRWSLHLRDCNCSLAGPSRFHLCSHTKRGVNIFLNIFVLTLRIGSSGISMASCWVRSCPSGCFLG